MAEKKKRSSKAGQSVESRKIPRGEKDNGEDAFEGKTASPDAHLQQEDAASSHELGEACSQRELHARKPFPVIGIGASAGGLEALEEFFQHVPKNSEMAYVVVSHTDPARSSLLPDIIRRRSNIPVFEVESGMGIEPNMVYLPPSNRDLELEGEFFQLREQRRGTAPRLPIDRFLKSLANSRGEQACCVILSGTGTDGTQGLRVVKEKGGVTVVQSTGSAKYEGMPESTGSSSNRAAASE